MAFSIKLHKDVERIMQDVKLLVARGESVCG